MVCEFRIHHDRLTVPHGALEFEVFTPAHENGHVFLFAHPHPLYGGSMYNPIVTLSAKCAVQAGWTAVRFNFRGIGQSTGQFTGEKGELQDFHVLAQWILSSFTPRKFWIGGYSFGAWISHLWGKRHPGVFTHWLGLAPPINMLPFSWSDTSYKQTIIVGSSDQFCSLPTLVDNLHHTGPDVKMILIASADHFFTGKEEVLEHVLRTLFAQ